MNWRARERGFIPPLSSFFFLVLFCFLFGEDGGTDTTVSPHPWPLCRDALTTGNELLRRSLHQMFIFDNDNLYIPSTFTTCSAPCFIGFIFLLLSLDGCTMHVPSLPRMRDGGATVCTTCEYACGRLAGTGRAAVPLGRGGGSRRLPMVFPSPPPSPRAWPSSLIGVPGPVVLVTTSAVNGVPVHQNIGRPSQFT